MQISNAIYGFSGLVREKYLDEGAQFKVELYRNPTEDSEMPKLVAVKTAKVTTGLEDEENAVPPPGGRSGRNDLLSFVQEMQVLSHLPFQAHPNILRLLGSSWTSDTHGTPIPQLIVEYASLGNLSDMLRKSVPLGTQTKLDLSFDIVNGLQHIHTCGIAHGDMKLSNIMVFPMESSRGMFTAKISDFGSSIARDDPDERKIYWGSPGYCPPDAQTEIGMSMPNLQKCDSFALGLCVWDIFNDGKSFYESDQSTLIRSGRDVPLNYPFLDKANEFLDRIHLEVDRAPIADAIHLGGETVPEPKKLAVRPLVKNLLHGLLDPIRSLRWSSKETLQYFIDECVPILHFI